MEINHAVEILGALAQPSRLAIFRLLVQAGEEGLAACVNRVAGVRSTYRWDGKLCDDAEVLLLIKTLETRFEALEARIRALHPYEVPEIIALPVVAGSTGYLDWVTRGSSGEAGAPASGRPLAAADR